MKLSVLTKRNPIHRLQDAAADDDDRMKLSVFSVFSGECQNVTFTQSTTALYDLSPDSSVTNIYQPHIRTTDDEYKA
jgi:hypothetical protein